MAEVTIAEAARFEFGTAADFAAHARPRLAGLDRVSSQIVARGDFDLNPDFTRDLNPDFTRDLNPDFTRDLNPDFTRDVSRLVPLVPAAVLVAIVARAPLTVLLTVRAAALKTHAGQVAFPGGRIEADDESPIAAAIREAGEEVGLSPGMVDPLGLLDPYITVTGFAITPVVALVDPGFVPLLRASEVAEVFEVPLAQVMDPTNHKLISGLWEGKPRLTYSIAWQPHSIWGATAGMLKNLSEKLSTP